MMCDDDYSKLTVCPSCGYVVRTDHDHYCRGHVAPVAPKDIQSIPPHVITPGHNPFKHKFGEEIWNYTGKLFVQYHK